MSMARVMNMILARLQARLPSLPLEPEAEKALQDSLARFCSKLSGASKTAPLKICAAAAK